ncbi:hypothetical protein EV121DRAFT_262846 [Schizophyllum commune]
MPRRAPAPPAQMAPPQPPSWLIPHIQKVPEQLAILRTNWKWAAFSQFFFTFNPLFNMDDVTLTAIEDDLYLGTNLVLPRVVQRLLWTLSYDRKSLSDAWQTVLRRQYAKRDPAANPIGPDPSLTAHRASGSRYNTAEPDASVQENGTSSPPPHRASSSVNDDLGNAADVGDSHAAVLPKESNDQDGNENGDRPDDVDANASDSVKPTDAVKEEAGEHTDEPVEEPKDWLQLPMLEKLDCIHLLTEWQFQNPSRLRQLMKSDGDHAEWRIEPIGYDVKKNAYWLIGEDRLWIQRAIPKPPRQNNKRKRPAATPAKTAKANKRSSAKRARVEPEPTPTKSRASTSRASTSRRKREASVPATPPTGGRGGSRAAKAQANTKLEAQAKELAELQRQAQLDANRRARPTGTRLSSRLRGREEDEEWQQVPDAWLNGDDEMDVDSGSDRRRSTASGRSTRSSARQAAPPAPERTPRAIAIANARAAAAKKRKAPDSDDEEEEEDAEADDKQNGALSDDSELTELSDDDEEEPQGEEQEVKSESEHAQEEAEEQKAQLEEPKEPPLPEGFVEWETIAVTLEEWEHVGDPFEKATHYLEKALYKTLTKVIAPLVIEDLRAVLREKQKEEAIVHRKRSSRIAVKESAKEEARLAAKRQAEEEEKNSRARRHEARLAKEQEQSREARESAREQRKREREEREERARREQEEKELCVHMLFCMEQRKAEEAVRAPSLDEHASKANGSAKSRRSHKRKAPVQAPATSEVKLMPAPSGSRTPEWELDCEVCHRHGFNLDDGHPMMCCGSCQRWQHIRCHDRVDLAAGRPKRDWNTVDFVCKRCRELAYARQQQQHQQQMPYYGAAARSAYPQHQYAMAQQPAAGYGAYQSGWGTGASQPYTTPYAGAYTNGHAPAYGQPGYSSYHQPASYAAANGAYANGGSVPGGSALSNGGYLGQAQPDTAKWAMHAPVPNGYAPAPYAESSRYLHTQQAPGTAGYGV